MQFIPSLLLRLAAHFEPRHCVGFLKQARRHVFKSGPAEVRASAEGTSGGEHERGRVSPSRKGGSASGEHFRVIYTPLHPTFI